MADVVRLTSKEASTVPAAGLDRLPPARTPLFILEVRELPGTWYRGNQKQTPPPTRTHKGEGRSRWAVTIVFDPGHSTKFFNQLAHDVYWYCLRIDQDTAGCRQAWSVSALAPSHSLSHFLSYMGGGGGGGGGHPPPPEDPQGVKVPERQI